MSASATSKPSAKRPAKDAAKRPAKDAAKRPAKDAAKRPAKAAADRPQSGPPGELSPELTELGSAFRHVFRTLSRLRGRDTHLGGSELSHAQFELLIELDERGELPAGELAAAARLTPATVTQMLDHLAACGHVERVRSETDRRVVVSRLTEQGRGKIAVKRAAWQSRWLAALEGVGARDLRAATQVLERLAGMFEEDPPVAGCEAGENPAQEGSQTPQ